MALERGDAEAVTELVRACEAHDGGLAERTLEDMQVIFDRPSFSLAESAIGVRDGGRSSATPRSRGAGTRTPGCCRHIAAAASGRR